MKFFKSSKKRQAEKLEQLNKNISDFVKEIHEMRLTLNEVKRISDIHKAILSDKDYHFIYSHLTSPLEKIELKEKGYEFRGMSGNAEMWVKK
jgi:hypothetical protein